MAKIQIFQTCTAYSPHTRQYNNRLFSKDVMKKISVFENPCSSTLHDRRNQNQIVKMVLRVLLISFLCSFTQELQRTANCVSLKNFNRRFCTVLNQAEFELNCEIFFEKIKKIGCQWFQIISFTTVPVINTLQRDSL